jgi:hypothetical protein
MAMQIPARTRPQRGDDLVMVLKLSGMSLRGLRRPSTLLAHR